MPSAPIYVKRDSLGQDVEWTVNGTSPANSPQAMVQAIQMLIGVAQNPVLGPASGLQIYELVTALMSNLPGMTNMKGVQATKDEVERRLNPASALSPGMAGPAGGQAVPGLPPDPTLGGGEGPAQMSSGPPLGDFGA